MPNRGVAIDGPMRMHIIESEREVVKVEVTMSYGPLTTMSEAGISRIYCGTYMWNSYNHCWMYSKDSEVIRGVVQL